MEKNEVVLPVVKITPQGEGVFVPKKDNLQGGIDSALNRSLSSPYFKHETCGSENHRLVELLPTSPHTPGDHMVFWIDGNPEGREEVTSWTDESWKNLLADTSFLSSVENHFKDLQRNNPTIKVYLYLGFVRPSSEIADKAQYAYPLQSQIRPHFHATEVVNADAWRDESRSMDTNNPSDLKQLGLFSNKAGERAIKDFAHDLKDYGAKFIYRQRIGAEEDKKYTHRTLFGFSSLQSAIEKSIELQKKISPVWADYIRNIFNKTFRFGGHTFPMLQSYSPNIAIIVPSETDRKNGNVKEDFPVWTMPFATIGAQILVPGGVITERATPYDAQSIK